MSHIEYIVNYYGRWRFIKFNQKLYYCANAIDSEEFKQYTDKASVYVDYRRKTFS